MLPPGGVSNGRFAARITTTYRHRHAMDATMRRPGEDHHRQVRWPIGHCRGQRVPEHRGLPGRMGQRVSRHAGQWGVGYGAVGAGGALKLDCFLANHGKMFGGFNYGLNIIAQDAETHEVKHSKAWRSLPASPEKEPD